MWVRLDSDTVREIHGFSRSTDTITFDLVDGTTVDHTAADASKASDIMDEMSREIKEGSKLVEIDKMGND